MIDHSEILAVAADLSLAPDVIEKDYVLGWLLAGIFRSATLARAWHFKGGTCLKKCYFETYRFSEDLDFTLSNRAHLNADFLKKAFGPIAAWIYDETGIEIPENRLRFAVVENPRGGLSCEGRVYYNGPLQHTGSIPRIKLDLTADEVLALPATERPVGHPYTDLPEAGIVARCYAYEELFAEKVRALGERTRPRDLYDVISLFRHREFRPAVAVVVEVLRRKCAFKGIPVPTLAGLETKAQELGSDWEAMLAHQLQALPPFGSFWDALPEFFSWLDGAAQPAPARQPLASGEQALRPPVGLLRRQGVRGSSFLETIRFAASNRLCVDLDYVDEAGQRSMRTIEPYALRRTRAGEVVLRAVRADNRDSRSYRLDRMRGAEITNRTFVPTFDIELSATEPGAIPPTARGDSSGGFGMPARPQSSQSASRGSGPKYVYECTYCRRRFPRSKHHSTLRPHKRPDGQDCPGRTGFWVETKQ